MQKQKSGFELANCDWQINFVFLRTPLSIFLWNLWIKAYLLWEFSEKFLFTLQALQFAYISKKYDSLHYFLWFAFFLSPKPQFATADLIIADHFWKDLWCLLCLFISDIKGFSVFPIYFPLQPRHIICCRRWLFC